MREPGADRVTPSTRRFEIEDARMFRGAGRGPTPDEEAAAELDVLFLATDGEVSRSLVEGPARSVPLIVDNSSAYRLDPDVPLSGTYNTSTGAYTGSGSTTLQNGFTIMTTLNAMLRRYLAVVAGKGSEDRAATELLDLFRTKGGRSRGRPPRREDAYEGRLSELKDLLVTDEDAVIRSIILEIRAGTGGDEATLFAAEIMRMYTRYAERQGWRVQLLDALDVSKRVMNNRVLEEAVENARQNIREGETIADPLKRSGQFPALVTHMIAVGERSGEMEEMLRRVSQIYDAEVERVITRFKSQKAAGLLAYLAFHRRQVHARELLIEMFWPGLPPEGGRNNLSVNLSSLRNQLETPGMPAGIVLRADRFSVGLNPQTEGQTIRVPIPELNEERRKSLVQVAHDYAEKSKGAVRHVRRDGMDGLKKAEKDGEIGQDESRAQSERVQKMTDEVISEIDRLLAEKEKEIMQV